MKHEWKLTLESPILVLIVLVSIGCRLNDNRIRGSIGSDSESAINENFKLFMSSSSLVMAQDSVMSEFEFTLKYSDPTNKPQALPDFALESTSNPVLLPLNQASIQCLESAEGCEGKLILSSATGEFGVTNLILTAKSSTVEQSLPISLNVLQKFSTESTMVSLPLSGEITLVSTGGGGTFTYNIVGDAKGATVNSSTGVFTAGAISGDVTVNVTDSLSGEIKVIVVSQMGLSVNPNLLAWFRASDNPGFSGGDGDPVTSWVDIQPGAVNASLATVGRQPTYRTSGINGQPSLYFDGDDYLDSNYLPVLGANPRTISLVISGANPFVSNLPQSPLSYGDNFSFLNQFLILINSDSQKSGSGSLLGLDFHCSSYNCFSTDYVLDSQPTIITTQYTGTTSKMYVNGRLAGSNGTAINTLGPLGMIIGGALVGGSGRGKFFTGDIAEILIYDSALNNADRLQVECALGGLYKIDINDGSLCSYGRLEFMKKSITLLKGDTLVVTPEYKGSGDLLYSILTGPGSINPTTGLFNNLGVTGKTQIQVKDSFAKTASITIDSVDLPVLPDFWLDASELDGFLQGDTIHLWPDRNGGDNSFHQVTSTQRPTYQAAGINGLPSVSFDGVNNFLVSSYTPATGNSNRSHYIVFKADNAVQADKAILSYGRGQSCSGEYAIYFNFSSSGNIGLDFRCTTFTSVGIADTNANLFVSEYENGSNQNSVYQNGNYLGGTVHALNTSLPLSARLGAKHDGSNKFAGEIAELMLFESVLLPAQRDAVTLYLKTKYNIP